MLRRQGTIGEDDDGWHTQAGGGELSGRTDAQGTPEQCRAVPTLQKRDQGRRQGPTGSGHGQRQPIGARGLMELMDVLTVAVQHAQQRLEGVHCKTGAALRGRFGRLHSITRGFWSSPAYQA